MSYYVAPGYWTQSYAVEDYSGSPYYVLGLYWETGYVQGEFILAGEIQSLAPSAVIELFQLDASNQGVAQPLYFHAGTNALRQPVVFQGISYTPFPLEISGFEYNGRGTLPRPTMRVSNIFSTITALLLEYNDLVGARLTRVRTLARYLDGQPAADPGAEFPREIYYVDRKVSESRDMVEFELASALDLAGVQLPRRQIIQNTCPWVYRSAECGYNGTSYFNANDQSVGSPALDVCGKRLSSCKARFGQYAELPFGGFPSAGLIRA